jgi:hypothetical protein
MKSGNNHLLKSKRWHRKWSRGMKGRLATTLEL